MSGTLARAALLVAVPLVATVGSGGQETWIRPWWHLFAVVALVATLWNGVRGGSAAGDAPLGRPGRLVRLGRGDVAGAGARAGCAVGGLSGGRTPAGLRECARRPHRLGLACGGRRARLPGGVPGAGPGSGPRRVHVPQPEPPRRLVRGDGGGRTGRLAGRPRGASGHDRAGLAGGCCRAAVRVARGPVGAVGRCRAVGGARAARHRAARARGGGRCRRVADDRRGRLPGGAAVGLGSVPLRPRGDLAVLGADRRRTAVARDRAGAADGRGATPRLPDGEGPLRFDRSFSLPHSDALRPAVELGLPAAFALVWLLIAARTRASATAGRAGLVVVGTQALIDDPLRLAGAGVDGCRAGGQHPADASDRATLFDACRAGGGAAVLRVGDRRPGTAAAGQPARGSETPDAIGWPVPATVTSPAASADRSWPEPELTQRLKRSTRLDPTDAWLQATRATAALAGPTLDDAVYANAREALERAARLDPEDARHRWNLAQLEARGCLERYRDLATCRRALQRFGEAAERAPFDARIAVDHGDFARALGNRELALGETRRAVELEPGSPVAWLARSRALLVAGDVAGSRDAFARAGETRGEPRPGASDFVRDLLQVDADVWARHEVALRAAGEADG